MRKFMFLLFTFLMAFTFMVNGQGLENFNNSNATSSYSDGNFVGENGITWYYIQSRDADGDANGSGITLPALMLRRQSSNSKVYSESISGGIGNFSVKLYKGFTGSGNRQVELFINDVSFGTSTPFDDYAEHIFSVNNINVSGNIVIRIDDITSKQVIVDDITWTGYSSGAPDNPTDFIALTASISQIDLSWTQNTNNDDVMVAWSPDDIFGTPVDGTTYTAGNGITGGGTVIYNGSATSFNHTGLTADTRYYYKAWSHDATPDYSSGVTDDTTTLATEPTADPSGFTATTNSASEITLTWTDASPAADYYLIKGSSVGYGDITDPVNGTPETDGGLVLNVASGLGTAQFSGLTPSTTYYFQIYPYNGDNGSVNYKTDSPQQASSTTDTHVNPNAWINEFHYDNVGTDVGEFVEIVIENAGSYALSDFQLDLYNGNGGVSYDTKTLDLYTAGSTEGNYTFYYYNYSSIQNGAPDGLALSYQGILIPGQFLSYEGTFSATDGPANGETSTDVGVSESNTTTQPGESLQLKGGGDVYDLFTWQPPAAETKGALNNNQYFGNYTTWAGSTDTDWATATNWNNGIPGASQNVIIPQGLTNYPTLSAAGNCNNIIIESNASLVGVNNLSVSGTATVERSIDGYTSNSNGFHFLSSPVSSFTIAGSDFEPVSGTDDFYSWDEATNTWLNYIGGTFTDTEFVVGKGYLVGYSPTNSGSFSGGLNNTSVTKSLSYTSGQGEGWNLLGNPYPSAIDWDLMTKSSGVDGAVYVLRGSDNTYVSWNGATGDLVAGEIPINNGFFVKAGSSGQSITMDPADQVHGSTDFLKSSDESSDDNTLKISITNDTFQNNTYIQFRTDATIEFDNMIDAYKLFGYSEGPQLFTTLENIRYSINCLPFNVKDFELPMGFKTKIDGKYTISADGFSSFTSSSFAVLIEDLETGDIVDLKKQNYTFTSNSDVDNSRFIIHFYSITAVGETPESQSTSVYSYDHHIYIRFNQVPKSGYDVQVFNTMGQQVYAGRMEPNTLNSFRLDEKTGIYIVRVKTKDGLVVQKVMIK